MSIAIERWQELDLDAQAIVKSVVHLLKGEGIVPYLDEQVAANSINVWLHAFYCIRIGIGQQRGFPIRSYDHGKETQNYINLYRYEAHNDYLNNHRLIRFINSITALVKTETENCAELTV